MRILVLGGYGYIGRDISNRLAAAGHDVTVLGRDAARHARLVPRTRWIEADLRALQSESDWLDRLEGIDAIVNAAGALQAGARDDLEAVHHRAVAGLVRACEVRGIETFVQISAVGSSPNADTDFMRSKARGDACVRRSSALAWIITRPGLVIGPNAYGGTALIRMLAGLPFVRPVAFGDARIQTVSIGDLSRVVLDAIEGRLPGRSEFDLVEDEARSLTAVIDEFRRWLGMRPPRLTLSVPDALLRTLARIADGLGYLGWRPPLRTTALRVLSRGVVGDPATFRRLGSRKLSSLPETLAGMPATLQDRWFARFYFAMPITLGVLASFWLLTGVIALARLDESVGVIGLAPEVGRGAVIAGSGVDLMLGSAVLYRPWARAACWGMAIVTLAYLVLGSVLRPELWADPLGPLLKAVPVLMLSVLAGAFLEER